MNSSRREAVISVSEKILNLKRIRDESRESLRKSESELEAANEELDRLLFDPNAVHLQRELSSLQSESRSAREGSNGSSSDRKEPPNKALYEYVAKNPIVDYRKAAVIVYGSDTKDNRDNVGAKLYYMKKLGWVKKGDARNEWRVDTPNGSEPVKDSASSSAG